MSGQFLGTVRGALLNPGGRGAYVVVNLATNVLFIARSYVAMLVLDYRELGLLALLQTVMAFVASMHLGLLNGGYRLLCSESGESPRSVNTLVCSFIALLGAIGIVVSAAYLLFGVWSASAGFVMVGVVAGVLTLLRSWMTNQLLATGYLADLNAANVKAIAISLLPLALTPQAPLTACVASVILQPFALTLLVWRARPELCPRSVEFSGPLFRALMRSGFMVFMTGVFTQLIAQAERWYVVKHLGLESLGHLYLTIMFVTVFQLIPTSLDSAVMPRLVKDYESGNVSAARRELRRMLALYSGYCFFALISVWLLAEFVVGLILPRYLGDLQYVYLVLPGLILFTLAGPFGIVFNVLIRYKAFLIAYGGGFLLALTIFGLAAWQGGALDLQGVAFARSAVLATMSLLLVALYFRTVRYFPALAMHRSSGDHRT